MIVYGIPTCDTTRKALKALEAAGLAPHFRDVRAEPLAEGEIAEMVSALGSDIVNRQSTSYRSFSAFLRESEPEAQIAASPTVMKRPVIRDGAGKLWLGWDDAVQTALLG